MVTYVKISDLPVATEAGGDDTLEVNQGGLTRQVSIDQIADFLADILPPLLDMSDYATDAEVADAIAAIPDPAWTDITGKPDLDALYVNVAGDTMTGTLNGTIGNWSGKQTITAADSAQAMLLRGTTKGVRLVPGTSEFAIEGVDQTGNASYQPLRVSGTEVRFGTSAESMRLTTQGLGIGVMPALARLHAWGGGQITPSVDTATAAGLRSTVYVQDSGVAAGNGGMVMFGAGQGAFATIKGHILNGGTNTAGDLVISTRRAIADATLTETARFKSDGSTTLAAALTGTTATFSGALTSGPHTVNGIDAANSLIVYNTAKTKFLTVKPETALNTAQLMYWNGAAAGTLEFPGATSMNGALTGTTAAFSGVVTHPTPTAGDNSTKSATTAFVAAALAAGASISVGTTPPGSPAANQLWWNTDASAGGGQLYIYYNDGNTTQWVPASPSVTTIVPPGADAGCKTTPLGANVALNNTTVYFNGPNTGAIGLAGQKWLISGRTSCNDGTGAVQFEARLWDGAAVLPGSSAMQYQGTAGGYTFLSCEAIVTLTAPTTFTLQARDWNFAGGTMFASFTAITAQRLT